MLWDIFFYYLMHVTIIYKFTTSTKFIKIWWKIKSFDEPRMKKEQETRHTF